MPFEHEYGDSADNYNTDFLAYPYRDMVDGLQRAGWRTPQTYCRAFDDAGMFSAVYLFLLVDKEGFERSLPAYVGMSTQLAQRWTGHPILRDLSTTGTWVQRWFLRVPKPDLRSVERQYIRKFDPPWNITGKVRGVTFQ